MRVFRTVAKMAAAAALFCAASTANAATVTDSNINSGTGSVADSGDLSVTFSWTSTPFSAHADFASTSGFDLTLGSFASNGGNSDVTGVILDLLDSLGDVVQRFTNDTGFCAAAAGPVAGNCNLFAKTGATGGNADGALNAGDSLGLFDAGTYRLGVFDSATPDVATAIFDISAVPVPAALPLFLSALVGLGYMARRRSPPKA